MVNRGWLQRHVSSSESAIFVVVCCSMVSTYLLVAHSFRNNMDLTNAERRVQGDIESVNFLNETTAIGESPLIKKVQDNVFNGTVSDSLIDASTDRMLEEILNKFPWIRRRRFTPNHFTSRRYGNTSPSRSYRNHSIVFLHNHKSGGTTMKICLQRIIQAKSLAPYYGLWDTNVAKAIETARVLEKKSRLYVTPYAFGICDELDDPYCAYFTVLRDPYERVVSSYEYCKRSRPDPHCAASNARKLTLKEWAVHQGSYFFRQLQFNPSDICSDLTRRKKVVKLMKEDNYYIGRKRNHPPCWFRHKLLLDNLLTKSEKRVLLQFMLDNLDKWFTVIGITDEYDTTLQLLQTVFKLPFYRLCSGLVEQQTQYNKMKLTKISRLQNIKKLKTEIEDDPEVFDALYYDIMIYQKALEIFNVQKRVYFEDVMRNLRKTQ
ncbi:uncharacterized protein LOC144433574 [Glandiceps talaboti]